MTAPNIAMARAFLQRLDAEAGTFTLQTFDDTAAKRRAAARVHQVDPANGALDALAGWNAKGAGVFVTVNATDGTGRQAHNIVSVRALFVDLDGAPLRPVLECAPAPHIVIESSPSRYHAYWRVDDCPLDQFERVQRALARRFDGDPSVHDLPRVMRLPGFLHRKGAPFLTHEVEGVGHDGPSYTLAEIVGGLRLEFDAAQQQRPAVNAADGKIAAGNRNAHLFAVGRSMVNKGLASEAVLAALLAENQAHCDPPLPDDRVRYVAERVFAAKDSREWQETHPGRDSGPQGDERTPDVSEGQPPAQNAPAGRAWGKPQPIRASLPPVPRFDADTLLPDPLRAWITDEAERMPCAPDFLAAAALVGLGAVIGARCAIKPKARDAWLIVPNLWGGMVALPSAKKSPAMSAAMLPIDRLAAKAAEAHRAELEAFETDATIHKARGEAIEGAIKAAAKKPGANINARADELRAHKASAPKPPTMRRYQTNDTTVAKVGELLRDNPTGMLIRRDELVGLLASWDREGNEGDRAFYLEAWNGTGSYYTDRIGRGSIAIPNLCLSIFGGIQPDKLTAYLEQAAHALANDGLLQRLQMLVYPDPRPWEWRDRSPDRQTRDAAFQLFETLADFDPVQWGATPADDGQRFPYFRFADGAQAVFIEWMHDLQGDRITHEQADGHPLIAQHLGKYEKLFPALALVLHLAECAATGRRGPVTEAAALRAAAWCDYLEAHARRCYGLLLDGGQRGAAMLASRIERGALADGFTAREVRRKGWRHLGTDADVNAALEWLEGEEWLQAVEPTQSAAGGRRTVRYLINPEISKAPGYPTDETDETQVSAVMAVPHPANSEELQGAAND